MRNTKKPVEQRKLKRFQVWDDAFVLLGPDSTKLVLCLTSLFKKYGFAIKPFSLLRARKCSMSLGKGFRLGL